MEASNFSIADVEPSFKPEQNDSQSQLLIDDQINDQIEDHINDQIEDDSSEDPHDLYMQDILPADGYTPNGLWLHCNMCGKSFAEKANFQLHYEEHFNKCTLCLAVFTNRDALNAHRKEMHGSSIEDTKVSTLKTKMVQTHQRIVDIARKFVIFIYISHF